MEKAGSRARNTRRFVVTEAERQVADLLPIEVAPEIARATVQDVPFWFHTFALNHAEGIYTPGAARDHRYRVAMLPADFAGMRVLDVGTFDGFYAYVRLRPRLVQTGAVSKWSAREPLLAPAADVAANAA